MTKEDLLWVAMKLVGLIALLFGAAGMVSAILVAGQHPTMSPLSPSLATNTLVAAAGAYLFFGGSALFTAAQQTGIAKSAESRTDRP